MAPGNNNNSNSNSNWLSFSLSPVDMLRTSQPPQHHHSPPPQPHHYYNFDHFYSPANGWSNPKVEVMYSETPNQYLHLNQQQTQLLRDHSDSTSIFSAFETNPPPKLEDFLGGDSYIHHHYTESQTDATQDDSSSLTHIYDNSDLKSFAANFQAFSTNSGSEVDDSASAQFQPSQSTESRNELVVYNNSGGVLSLGVNNNNNNKKNENNEKAIVAVGDANNCKKIADTFGQRTSIYRGVTRHRWTGRYEAHLWDNSCRREGQARKGRQVYLGGYDKEDKAARAYDLAALKYWGPTATTNFPAATYCKEMEEMKNATKQEFIASLRRKSSGFSRGASIYRGVTRHHQQGRWQARIGRVAGNKDLYLGTFATEEEAAEAYDIAAIKFRGVNAVTNFEMNRYDVEAISKSSLPVGGTSKRLKLSLDAEQKSSFSSSQQQQSSSNSENSISFAAIQSASAIPYGLSFDSATPMYHQNLFHHLYSGASTSETPGSLSSIATPTSVPLLSSQEFYLWPHQTY
nr:PREDICTED: AP2-like ethylene-responsive transcription factor AIL6 [Daucus carota subsp. sativus]